MSKLERGAASLKITLEDSVITISHGSSKEVLIKTREVKEGTWYRMLQSIVSELGPTVINRTSIKSEVDHA